MRKSYGAGIPTEQWLPAVNRTGTLNLSARDISPTKKPWSYSVIPEILKTIDEAKQPEGLFQIDKRLDLF